MVELVLRHEELELASAGRHAEEGVVAHAVLGAFLADPVVNKLIEQGAVLVPDSIRPLKEN